MVNHRIVLIVKIEKKIDAELIMKEHVFPTFKEKMITLQVTGVCVERMIKTIHKSDCISIDLTFELDDTEIQNIIILLQAFIIIFLKYSLYIFYIPRSPAGV